MGTRGGQDRTRGGTQQPHPERKDNLLSSAGQGPPGRLLPAGDTAVPADQGVLLASACLLLTCPSWLSLGAEHSSRQCSVGQVFQASVCTHLTTDLIGTSSLLSSPHRPGALELTMWGIQGQRPQGLRGGGGNRGWSVCSCLGHQESYRSALVSLLPAPLRPSSVPSRHTSPQAAQGRKRPGADAHPP